MTKSAKKEESSRLLSFSDQRFDHEKYAAVAQSIQLLEISLVKQIYETKVELIWNSSSDEDLRYGFKGKPKGHSYDLGNGAIAGGYEWLAEIKKGRRKALKLTAEYLLLYQGEPSLDEEYVQLYFNKVARFTSYPYFRALFSASTGNSALALAPLPSLIDRVD